MEDREFELAQEAFINAVQALDVLTDAFAKLTDVGGVKSKAYYQSLHDANRSLMAFTMGLAKVNVVWNKDNQEG